MSEKNQPSEFTCNVMERIQKREKLKQDQDNLQILENAISAFNTSHTALTVDSASEIQKQLIYLKKLISNQQIITHNKANENNRILDSLLQSAIEFK